MLTDRYKLILVSSFINFFFTNIPFLVCSVQYYFRTYTNNKSVSYFNLHSEIDSEGRIRTNIYDKRDCQFCDLFIYMDQHSNRITHGVYASQLIRYSNILDRVIMRKIYKLTSYELYVKGGPLTGIKEKYVHWKRIVVESRRTHANRPYILPVISITPTLIGLLFFFYPVGILHSHWYS